MSNVRSKPEVTDEDVDSLFVPSIEESILASGGHSEGRVHAPDPGDDQDPDDILAE
jgi:hypothetical protein